MEEVKLFSEPHYTPSTIDFYNRKAHLYCTEINNLLENKQDVFVKFSSSDRLYPNSIAKVSSITTNDAFGEEVIQTMRLKWDNKRGNPVVKLGYSHHSKLTYLRGYTGKTIYNKFDKDGYIKNNAQIPLDSRGQEIKLNDIVIYIHNGDKLHLGSVKKIDHRIDGHHSMLHGVYTVIHIENISTNEKINTKIRKFQLPSTKIMVMTDVDICSEALAIKLIN